MPNAQLLAALAALAVLEETAYQTRKAIQDFSDAHPEEFPGSPEITEALEGIIGVTGAIHRAEKVIENKIIRRVLARAQKAGYTPSTTTATYYSTDRIKTPTAEDVIRIFRTQDADSYVRLLPPAASVGIKAGWVRFIGGNGEDVFADYSDSLRPIFEDWDPAETGDAEMGEGA